MSKAVLEEANERIRFMQNEADKQSALQRQQIELKTNEANKYKLEIESLK